MNPFQTLTPYFPKIHSDIIIPFTPRSFECSLFFKLSDQKFVYVCHLSRLGALPKRKSLSFPVFQNTNRRLSCFYRLSMVNSRFVLLFIIPNFLYEISKHDIIYLIPLLLLNNRQSWKEYLDISR